MSRREHVVGRPAAPFQAVGRGAGRAVWSGRNGVVVVDEAVVDRLAHLGPGIEPDVVVDHPTRLEDVAELAAMLRVASPETVLAVGGGNVLDLVKLALGCAAHEGLLPVVATRSDMGGLCSVPSALWRPESAVAIPTTLGTGAEVSTAACCEVQVGADVHKVIIGLPSNPVGAVAYDPDFLSAPAELLMSGTTEALLRILGAAVGSPTSLGWADSEAVFLIGACAENARRSCSQDDDDTLLGWALASAQTHLTWGLRGRGLAPSPLWFVANEFSVCAGCTKMEATVALLPLWLIAIRRGVDLWGSNARLDRFMEAGGFHEDGDFLALMRELIPARPTSQEVDTWAPLVGARVERRFGRGRPLPGGFTASAIASMMSPANPEWAA